MIQLPTVILTHENYLTRTTPNVQLLSISLGGIGTPESVRKWCRQAEIKAGAGPGVPAEEPAEVRRLKRENAELKRANAISKAASVFFAAELDRPRL